LGIVGGRGRIETTLDTPMMTEASVPMSHLIPLSIIALATLALVWCQHYKLAANASYIAILEQRVELQRRRIDVAHTRIAVEQEYAKLLEEELCYAERRADHMEQCVRRIVETTPKATAARLRAVGLN
jgi:hypothetical protein